MRRVAGGHRTVPRARSCLLLLLLVRYARTPDVRDSTPGRRWRICGIDLPCCHVRVTAARLADGGGVYCRDWDIFLRDVDWEGAMAGESLRTVGILIFDEVEVLDF